MLSAIHELLTFLFFFLNLILYWDLILKAICVEFKCYSSGWTCFSSFETDSQDCKFLYWTKLHIILSYLVYFRPLDHVLKSWGSSWENFSIFVIFSYWPFSLEHFLSSDFYDYRNYFYIIYNKNKVSAIFPFEISLDLVLWQYDIFPCFLNLKNPSALSSLLFYCLSLRNSNSHGWWCAYFTNSSLIPSYVFTLTFPKLLTSLKK